MMQTIPDQEAQERFDWNIQERIGKSFQSFSVGTKLKLLCHLLSGVQWRWVDGGMGILSQEGTILTV